MYALPFGTKTRYAPYASGGIGAMYLRGHLTDQFGNEESFQQRSAFAWNYGVGAAGYYGHWGLRGDVRYYRATSDGENPDFSTPHEVARGLLSGLTYWRWNLGLAARW